MSFLKLQKGRKRSLGIILAGLLLTIYGSGLLIHDNPSTSAIKELSWMTEATYITLAGLVTSLFGVGVAHGYIKEEKN